MKNVALNCGWWRLWKPVPIGLIRHGANLGTIQDRDKLLCRWETTFVFGLPLPRLELVRPICSRPPTKDLLQRLSRASPPRGSFLFYRPPPPFPFPRSVNPFHSLVGVAVGKLFVE